MKTSRSGSRSSWPSNQSCRCFRTSGRSCSIAWPVFFCASCRDERRSGEARPQRRSGRSRLGPRATPQARYPCVLPRARECPPAAPRHGVIACRRLGVLGQYCRSCAAVPASGSPSMARPQSEPQQHGNSSPHQSPQEAGHANPTIKADPSILASFTSTDSESENLPLGNPLRFKTVENRSRTTYCDAFIGRLEPVFGVAGTDVPNKRSQRTAPASRYCYGRDSLSVRIGRQHCSSFSCLRSAKWAPPRTA